MKERLEASGVGTTCAQVYSWLLVTYTEGASSTDPQGVVTLCSTPLLVTIFSSECISWSRGPLPVSLHLRSACAQAVVFGGVDSCSRAAPKLVRLMGLYRSLSCPVYALIVEDVFNLESTTIIRALPPQPTVVVDVEGCKWRKWRRRSADHGSKICCGRGACTNLCCPSPIRLWPSMPNNNPGVAPKGQAHPQPEVCPPGGERHATAILRHKTPRALALACKKILATTSLSRLMQGCTMNLTG